MRQQISFKKGDITVTETFPEGGPLSVTVTAKVGVNTTFAGIVGVNSFDVSKLGQASRAVENVEAVITLASNGTMCSHKARTPNTRHITPGDTLVALSPDPSCAHFKAMKQGVREFVRIVEENETVADIKVGLVPYNVKVRMPDTDQIPPSLEANEPAGFYADVSDAEPLSPVLPLTSDIDKVTLAIGNPESADDGLRQSERGRAWSRSDLGTHVAGLMLDPSQTLYFPNGETPKDFNTPTTQKIMIMMTDGANIGCCFTNVFDPVTGKQDFTKQYVYFYEQYNKAQIEICDELKKNGVKIFSILFDVSEKDQGGQQINDVFSRCASGTVSERVKNASGMQKCKDKTHCYNVANDKELIDTYRQIAQTFYQPVITK